MNTSVGVGVGVGAGVFVGAGVNVAVAGADSVEGGSGVGFRGCCMHAAHKDIRVKSRRIGTPFP